MNIGTPIGAALSVPIFAYMWFNNWSFTHNEWSGMLVGLTATALGGITQIVIERFYGA